MSTNAIHHGSSDGDIPAPDANAVADMVDAGPATSFDQLVAQSELSSAVQEGNEERAKRAANAVAELRANAQLREDEWRTLDERLIRVAQKRLVVVEFLREQGLVVNEDLGTLIREYEKTDEFGDADVDMSPSANSGEDKNQYSIDGVPLPIVHKSFQVDRRFLLASRQRGDDLRAQGQSKAARSVAEGIDSLVWDGWGGSMRGYTADGLTTHPDRNTVTIEDPTDSNTSTQDLRNDVIAGIEAIEDDEYGGVPLAGFFGRSYWQRLRREDTGTDQERGLLERLRNELADDMMMLEQAPTLADDEAVIFEPSPDVIELAIASDIQNVEWDSGDGFKTNMKVMASITPVVKSDESNQSGVAHLAP
jgi:uncharacterized linocin/CFP29 family protein